MSEVLFQQYLIVLSFSLLGVLVLRRARMASIVAYMIVGILIGPSAMGFIEDPGQFSFIAEFGVVFLLFSLGLEFNFKKMIHMRFAVFGVGGFQVAVCTALFFAAVYLWGNNVSTAIVIAGSLALSSTAIVTRELSNLRQLHNQHGQLSIGVLLFQDLIAVVFLVLVPVLASGSGENLGSALLTAAGSAVVLVAILLAAGAWVLPLVFKEVSKANSEEIFLLTTLVVVLLAAWLTHTFHLSMTLGAFIIGMMLGESSTKYQIESDIRPFKDILLGLFFVTIGMNLDLVLLFDYWPRILLFTIGLVLIKSITVTTIVRLLGFSLRDATTVGLNLAQAGEFGLALLTLTLVNEVLPPDQASFIIIIAIFTMIISPFLIRHADSIGEKIFPRGSESSRSLPVNLQLENHVIIGGFGRLGNLLTGFLENNDIPYIAVETNIETVEENRKNGRNIVYGNSNNIEILRHCRLASAKLMVLTFKSIEEGKNAISRIRQTNQTVPIIVRCQDHGHYDELISLGANQVFPEVLESSLLITRQVLGLLEVDEEAIDMQLKDYLESLPVSKNRNPI